MRIIKRLSRNRWLSPEDVNSIGLAAAVKYSRTPSHTFNRAIMDTCCFVGMINGEPPCYPQEKSYKAVFNIVKRHKKDNVDTLIKIIKAIGDN